MTVLNASTNMLLASAVLIYCWRRWRKGHRGVATLFAVYAVWLLLAALARWYGGTIDGVMPTWTRWVQSWAWIPRLAAAWAFMWMTALNGHHRCPEHRETIEVIKQEVTAARNGR